MCVLIGLPGGRERIYTRIFAYIRVYTYRTSRRTRTGCSASSYTLACKLCRYWPLMYAYIRIYTRIFAYIRVYTYRKCYSLRTLHAYILIESATVWLANFAGTGSVYLMCTQRELGAGCSTLPCTGQCVSNVMYLMCT